MESVSDNLNGGVITAQERQEFEEFKAHAASQSGQMKHKPAPKQVACGSNASVVVMDEISDES